MSVSFTTPATASPVEAPNSDVIQISTEPFIGNVTEIPAAASNPDIMQVSTEPFIGNTIKITAAVPSSDIMQVSTEPFIGNGSYFNAINKMKQDKVEATVATVNTKRSGALSRYLPYNYNAMQTDSDESDSKAPSIRRKKRKKY